MNILAMDTSNQTLGVALLRDSQLAGAVRTNIKRNHSVRLMPAVSELMQEVGMTPTELDRIVVARGPGSYTGVRIGLTTAKSLAWSLDIPVVGVSSLEALAWQGFFSAAFICPFFDARRGLVFTGLYQGTNDTLTPVVDEQNVLMDDWLKTLADSGNNVLFLSPDMVKHVELIRSYLGDRALIPDGPFHMTDPSHLAFAGLHTQPGSTHALTPNYLRMAEAEAKWLAQERGNHG